MYVRRYTSAMNTTTLLAILMSVLVRAPRRVPPVPESYDWVAGEIRPGERDSRRAKSYSTARYSNWTERFERPRK